MVEGNRIENAGVISIVGMGPGDGAFLTGQARDAIESADVVVGYTLYTKLLAETYPEKEYRSTGMKQEIERCRLCFQLAAEGKNVALICSGDAGVYGMASPTLELAGEYPEVEIVVVPGITAALSGGAVLGAPLGHDFAVISLSDLLTPWEVIERRLRAACNGDFVTVLYNPSSHKREDYLERAIDILLNEGMSPDTATGYVENIGREGTHSYVCSLSELKSQRVNMFTTVFIGNSNTYMENGRLITPRGYKEKHRGE